MARPVARHAKVVPAGSAGLVADDPLDEDVDQPHPVAQTHLPHQCPRAVAVDAEDEEEKEAGRTSGKVVVLKDHPRLEPVHRPHSARAQAKRAWPKGKDADVVASAVLPANCPPRPNRPR